MRTTSFQRNCALENDEQAVSFAINTIKQKYPGCRIEKIEDEIRQKKGIDYIVHTTNGQINIDVKIRHNIESYWSSGDGQDLMMEFKQGSAEYGWGTDPNLETDWVLFCFPFGNDFFYKMNNWKKSVWMPHNLIQNVIIPKLKNKLPVIKGWNGYAYSYCICPKIADLRQLYQNHTSEYRECYEMP
jgi:hypothetical protein